jgi:hypothetical protein
LETISASATASGAGGAESGGGGGLSEPVSTLPEGVILKAVGDSCSYVGGKPKPTGGEGEASREQQQDERIAVSFEDAAAHGTGGPDSETAAAASAPLPVLSTSPTLATAYSSSLYDYKFPVAVIELSTANTVMMSALEWGDVMVVKDTVQYFGRNAGLVQDLFISKSATPAKTLVSRVQEKYFACARAVRETSVFLCKSRECLVRTVCLKVHIMCPFLPYPGSCSIRPGLMQLRLQLRLKPSN